MVPYNQERSLQTDVALQVEMFSNRLKKRKKHLWKWARRNDITCFRVYARDIPEVPFVVDIYDNHLHVAEYERPHPHTPEEHRQWQDLMLDAAAHALTVPRERVFFKYREKPDGGSQYQKMNATKYTITVREAGLSFLVNLSDYVDTGLFLDHRATRSMVRDMSAGKRVLNLYSYTGSFSVYAASGGAKSVTSVDLSQNYTSWATENLRLNGFIGPAYATVADDVGSYIERARAQHQKFDLIVLDPPTFSNSKKMAGVLDIQRDHAALINSCLELLNRDGTVMFSSNFKRLKLDHAAIRARQIDDITGKTVPEDFVGKKPHHAWLISGQKRGRNGKK